MVGFETNYQSSTEVSIQPYLSVVSNPGSSAFFNWPCPIKNGGCGSGFEREVTYCAEILYTLMEI